MTPDDFQKLGCTNPAANNYDADAIIDDDSCEVVDGAISIATIQQGQTLDPPVFTDSLVTVSGIVTGVYGSLFSLQEGTGAYSGMFGFNPEVAVTVGDFVALTGVIGEYFGLTQIQGVGGNPLVTSIVSQGNDLPQPKCSARLRPTWKSGKASSSNPQAWCPPRTSATASGASTTVPVNCASTTADGTTRPPVRWSSTPSSR